MPQNSVFRYNCVKSTITFKKSASVSKKKNFLNMLTSSGGLESSNDEKRWSSGATSGLDAGEVDDGLELDSKKEKELGYSPDSMKLKSGAKLFTATTAAICDSSLIVRGKNTRHKSKSYVNL